MTAGTAAAEVETLADGRVVLRSTDAARARTLVFDEEQHRYFVDGREHVSCTTVVAGLRRLWGHETPEFQPIHSALGTALHRAIELDVLGALDESTVDERLAAKLEANRGWRRLADFVPALIEHAPDDLRPALEVRVWSPEGCAGTVDAIGYVGGVLSIVDWKSTWDGGAAVQMAGYKRMIRFVYGVEIERRWVVKHFPDGTFKPVAYSDPLDERRFACGMFLLRDGGGGR